MLLRYQFISMEEWKLRSAEERRVGSCFVGRNSALYGHSMTTWPLHKSIYSCTLTSASSVLVTFRNISSEVPKSWTKSQHSHTLGPFCWSRGSYLSSRCITLAFWQLVLCLLTTFTDCSSLSFYLWLSRVLDCFILNTSLCHPCWLSRYWWQSFFRLRHMTCFRILVSATGSAAFLPPCEPKIWGEAQHEKHVKAIGACRICL